MLMMIMFALSFSLFDFLSLFLSAQNFSVYFLKYKKIILHIHSTIVNIRKLMWAQYCLHI